MTRTPAEPGSVGTTEGRAPNPPPSADSGVREKVARIIDPDGWATRDQQNREIDRIRALGFMSEDDATRARASTAMYVDRSTGMADAILALPALQALAQPAQDDAEARSEAALWKAHDAMAGSTGND